MTNEELTVLAKLAGELRDERVRTDEVRISNRELNELHGEIARLEGKLGEEVGKRVRAENEAKQNADERDQLRERNAMATAANEELKKRCTELMAERDEARRKLGALTLCVGFLKDYDTRHPKKTLEAFREEVKKCFDDNHIVLTKGGMAK